MLSPTDQRLVEFLLLLPVAALIVCVFRNVIGLTSFGTFAPALLGLAFRELHSLPGILVFVCIVLIGWLMRRVLNHYHLLQVPRIAFMLSLVVVVLIGLDRAGQLPQPVGDEVRLAFSDGHPDRHDRALLDAGDGGRHRRRRSARC